MASSKKNGGVMYPNPYNETMPGEMPDDSGGGVYGDYEEVISMQLSQQGADLMDTPNSKSGEGIFGGPAKGEPNPAGMKSTC